MKKILGLIGLALILLVASCTKEDSSADPRDKLVGTWKCTESSKNTGQSVFTVTIKKSASDNLNIIVTNFYNLGPSTNAIIEVNGTTNLTIQSQLVSGRLISGTGSCTTTGSQINFSFTSNDNQSTDVVTEILNK